MNRLLQNFVFSRRETEDLSRAGQKKKGSAFFYLLICCFCAVPVFGQQEFKVQRGVATIPAGSATLTLSAPADFDVVSSLQKAFVRITNSQHTGAGLDSGGGSQSANNVTAQIQFDTENQITITRFGTANNTRVCWEIIEYIGANGGQNEFTVLDQGVKAFTGGSLTASVSFPAASDVNKLVGFVTGVANPDAGRRDYETGLVTTSFPDSSTLRFDRGNAGNDAVQVSYAVVEFTGSNWAVDRVEHQYGVDGTVETEATTASDIAHAFIHTQKRNVGDLKGLDEFGHQVWLSAANEVSFKIRLGSSTPSDQYSVAWIISNPDMNIYRSNGRISNGGPEPQTNNISIPSVKLLPNTSLFWNNDCKGGGTAFPRPVHAVRLTSITNVEMWRSDTGQPQDYRYEVVQWPIYPVMTIEGTVYTDSGMTTPIAAGKNISLSVNGAIPQTVQTQTGGTFRFELYSSPSSGDVLLVYLDGETEKGSLVTITDGTTSLTGSNALSLVTDKVILENQGASSISNNDLDVIDGVSSNDDDGITVSGGSAFFTSGREVWISSAATYIPGGNVALDDIKISGIFSAESNTVTVTGDWNNSTGTFTAGTSKVAFSTGGVSAVSGDTLFYDFECAAASKTIAFEQGSTQTVSGKFLIDGTDFSTRVKLLSSGGSGTTWNLVLNGTHDCRYVDVQGSTASGSVYLPVNPVAFKDSGDNTNWYAPSLPTEMLFYDNFETSTLNTAPPDKTSSHWTTDSAGWFTQPSTVVDTQNHTPGGANSMYSSGGPAGEGIGAWNSPSWGPFVNCTAEAWFYDDMQADKIEWLFVDNAAGDQGIGVMIDTYNGQGATKYRYSTLLNNSMNHYDSYIDRTLGWHHVKWVHTDGTVDLYLDGVRLISGTGLTDFSTFDTGSWYWTNNSGSTPMWFDDFMVYRSQHQSSFRWYDNDDAENPTPIDSENTWIERDIGALTRLRVQVQNDQYEAWSAEHIALQYREGENGTWLPFSSSGDWNYADGLGTDGSQLANALLNNTNIRQFFVESLPSSAVLTMNNGEYGEWDFSLISTANAKIGTTYYFRPVITDASGNFKRPLAAYEILASCDVTSPNMKFWTGRASTSWNNRRNWSPQSVPVATDDVIIPSGTSNDCHLNISGAVAASMTVRDGAEFYMDAANTDLTISDNMTVNGTVTHSSDTAVLNLNAGTLGIDGANAAYNHSGAGALNAANAVLRVINGGDYNVTSNPSVTIDVLQMDAGGLVNVSGAALFNVNDFTISLNAQWLSTNTANVVNIAGDFVNNGSMQNSTGGLFTFNSSPGGLDGTSTTTTMYQAVFNGTTAVGITNTVTVLDDLTIQAGATLTASAGMIAVGGDWTDNGTFINGGGTVEFNGASAQRVVTGGSDWNHILVANGSGPVTFSDSFNTAAFKCETPGTRLAFGSGATYSITDPGGLLLKGTAGNEIRLARDGGTDPDKWTINPSGGAWDVEYVDVADSFNSYSEPILPVNSTDGGDTINWFSDDQDNDQLPDYWEYGYYHTLANGPGDDTDGDGVTLFEELVLNDNPTIAMNRKIYVDDNAGYIGDGSISAPYKYLEDALDNASDGTLIILAPGTYELDGYNLTKRVAIRGDEGAYKTVIRGAAPDGTSSDSGQMLNIDGKSFEIENVTLTLFRDDKPVISFKGDFGREIVSLSNVIFRENTITSKAIIAPSSSNLPKKLYLFNCLFYNNTASNAIEAAAEKKVEILNNTIVNNTFFSALLLQEARKMYVINNILRNGGNEITDNTSGGRLEVSYCNIEGGFTGAANSYDSAEDFMDQPDFYRFKPASSAQDAGTSTGLNWDLENKPRPDGSFYDVGCYELQANDYDGDGITNADEANFGTDELKSDSDGDGLFDGDEVNVYSTDPNIVNTDGDFIDDGDEVAMGMDPSVADGDGDIGGVYATGFEDPAKFPEGPLADTIWGPGGNPNSTLVIKGNVTIENVGADAYDGVKVAKAAGEIPESSVIGWVDRNSLDDYWMTIAYKCPWAKLPTDINEAFNLAGVFFAIDENGYLNVYDAAARAWRKNLTRQIPENTWVLITVHRNHPTGTVDFYIEGNSVFTGIHISTPDPAAGTGKFRISYSSVGEKDVFLDDFSAQPITPF